MFRSPQLPLLPGYCFNKNLGQVRFHKPQHFTHLKNLPILDEKEKSGIGGAPLPGSFQDRYPSIYNRGEVIEIPSWIAFDKQVLGFDAFFQETLQEIQGSPFTIRRVKIFFYLEDGTIQVVEPKVDNSGIPQGTLISRQRIKFPPPRDGSFYDIIDFNIGRELEFYGRVFKITNCDKFTRQFLNRCGIPVPDPINIPEDPYFVKRDLITKFMQPKKPNRNVDTLGQFLEFDRKVLRFYGYWDDRETEYGIFHDLEIYYYLADDTVEIKEILPKNLSKDSGVIFLKRAKLPKNLMDVLRPGEDSNYTLLNVLGTSIQTSRYIADSLNCGKANIEYYKANDLAIGAAINVYGRKILLTDCDPFTKQYYSQKYGLDNFEPVSKPIEVKNDCHSKQPVMELPPWNGYGTYEDSAVNCKYIELKPPHRDFVKFLNKDRMGYDSHILRFAATMISRIDENCKRIFIVSYYLSDDTISVFELAYRNSGFLGGMFFTRNKIKLPGQEIYSSEPPKCYEAKDLYVGAKLNINDFIFVLTDADQYAFRYMEVNCNEFPKSNIKLIMEKVRQALKPVYKEFIAEYLPRDQPVISYEDLRYALCKNMKEPLTEHEMITISRYFQPKCRYQRFARNDIRSLTLTEIKRSLWNDLDRLHEYLIARDINNTGYLPRQEVYALCRGCRLPMDVELINAILDVVAKNEQCEIDYNDLVSFLNVNWDPLPDAVPINVKRELYWGSETDPKLKDKIDWCVFNKELNLEELIIQQST